MTNYHVVDCGDRDCRTCPAAFRGEDEQTAIEQAKAHEGKVDVVDIVST